jgi:hypothetical protein
MQKSRFKLLFAALSATAAVFQTAAQAATAYTFTPSTVSGFNKISVWMGQFLDFMQGQFGPWVVAIGILAAFAVWMWSPREGVMGPLMRVVLTGLVVMNVGLFMSLF